MFETALIVCLVICYDDQILHDLWRHGELLYFDMYTKIVKHIEHFQKYFLKLSPQVFHTSYF
jgi:hypothetical protein